jgi:uncharacterized membrane protein
MDEQNVVPPESDVTHSTEVPPEDVVPSSDDKLWALLGWIIWLIALIVLLLEDKKDRPFIKYNAIQSLAFGVVMIVLSFIPIIGWLLDFVLWVYAIYLGVQAYNGKWVEVPVVTDFVKNQGWI